MVYLDTAIIAGELAGFVFSVRKNGLLAMIPTVIYGVLFYALNFFRIYDGPYPFMRVHQQPWHMSLLWFAVIAAVAYGTASALRSLCGKRKMPEI